MFNLFKGFNNDVFVEQEQTLFSMEKGRVVRIKSSGQTSPADFWYEQEEDEWVMVLEGEGQIEYPDGKKLLLQKGDSVFLPAFKEHRVSYTSSNPPCIWLAIYGKINLEDFKC